MRKFPSFIIFLSKSCLQYVFYVYIYEKIYFLFINNVWWGIRIRDKRCFLTVLHQKSYKVPGVRALNREFHQFGRLNYTNVSVKAWFLVFCSSTSIKVTTHNKCVIINRNSHHINITRKNINFKRNTKHFLLQSQLLFLTCSFQSHKIFIIIYNLKTEQMWPFLSQKHIIIMQYIVVVYYTKERIKG